MIHIPHELRDEFPKEAHFIERLIKTDYEFGRDAQRVHADKGVGYARGEGRRVPCSRTQRSTKGCT